MANLDNQDSTRRFYPVDHTVVSHTQSASAFQTVSEWFSELDWIRREALFDGSLDLSSSCFRQSGDIFPNNRFKVFNFVRQSQALS